MRTPSAIAIAVGVPLVALAQQQTDPVGPARCFATATGDGLEPQKALQLCTGALTNAPAECYAEAVNRSDLSDLQSVRLCQLADSIEPARCAEQLQDTTTLPNAQLVGYCAAQRLPTIPAPYAGSPACLQAALDRTLLSDYDALTLCRGSTTTDPVACYEWAQDNLLTISNDALARLCAKVVPYPVLGVY